VAYKPYSKIESKIGKELKRLRVDAGYTSYEHFSVYHDIDRKHYWLMEKGHNLQIKTLYRILKAHKIKFSDFFARVD